MTQNSGTRGRYISFRVSGKDSEVIEALMELWGENQSQTIKRALQIAYDIELQIQVGKPVIREEKSL